MSIHKTLFFVTGLAALFATASYAQNAKEPNTVIAYCLKAAPGKYAEAAAFVQDAMFPSIKLAPMQARSLGRPLRAGLYLWVDPPRAIFALYTGITAFSLILRETSRQSSSGEG